MNKRPPLDSAKILITGASAGLGIEFARQLAPRVKALVLVARREERLLEQKKSLEKSHPGLSVHAIACDVSQTAEIEKMLLRIEKEVGEIDILINNAGLGDVALFENTSWPKVEQMIAVNIVGLTFLTRQLINQMVKRGRGGILMVASTAGFQSLPAFGVYSGTKYYVRGFSDALRAEVLPAGVVVTQLCPGPVATEFLSVALPGNKNAVPDFAQISAEKCVRVALKGFARGKAVVIPGFIIHSAMLLHAVTPKWIMRWLLAIAAKRGRSRLLQIKQTEN